MKIYFHLKTMTTGKYPKPQLKEKKKGSDNPVSSRSGLHEMIKYFNWFLSVQTIG